MRVKILALVLLGLLLTAPFTQMACAASVESGAGESNDYSADEGNDNKVTETVFNSIKLAAEARRDEAFSKMSEDLPPSVLSNIREALNLMEEAEGSEATDMGAATQSYMQAMKLFRDSWKYMDDGDAQMPTGETSGSDEPVLVEEQNENLNEEILIAKQQLLLRFQTNFQNRIETMYSHIQDLSGAMDPEDSAKAENALVSAVEKLREVQKNMTDGDLEDALLELDATSNGLEDEFKNLKDKEAADLIVSVDKLEGKVQKLTEENTKSSGKNGSDAPEDTSDEPKASDEAKVTEEPKPKEEPKVTEEPKPKEEPKVTEEPKPKEEPKGNSDSSGSSSSGSTVNGDSQRNSSKSTEDQINDLKEKIQKSLEDFREKRNQQTSDNNGNSSKNGNDNGNGNSNSSEKSNANSAENSNGNSAKNNNSNGNSNSSNNSNSNGNGNGNSKGNQGKSKNH